MKGKSALALAVTFGLLIGTRTVFLENSHAQSKLSSRSKSKRRPPALSEVIRAAGQRALFDSQAAGNVEVARREYLDNRVQATNAFFAMREYNRRQRYGTSEEKAARHEENQERYTRLGQLGNPKQLASDQLDPATGKLTWPRALMSEPFAECRRQLDVFFAKRAKSGGYVRQQDATEAYATLERMFDSFANASGISSRDANEAISFLTAVAVAVESPYDRVARGGQRSVPEDPPKEVSTDERLAAAVALLKSENRDDRVRACANIAAFGEGAASAVPGLIQALKDSDAVVRAYAARALGQVGRAVRAAAEPLERAFEDPNRYVRREALRAFVILGPKGRRTVDLIIAAMNDVDPLVVATATNKLTELGPRLLPQVIELLEDDRTAYCACLILQGLDQAGVAAVPALIKLLDHQLVELRLESASALRAIGPAAADAVAALSGRLDDSERMVQLAAVLALGTIGEEAATAAKSLRQMASHPDDLLKVLSLWALQNVQPNKEELNTKTAPRLYAYAKSDSQEVRQMAILALWELEPSDEVSMAADEEFLATASKDAIADALEAASLVGEGAVPYCIKCLERPALIRAAAVVLGKIGPEAADAVPALLKQVNNEEAVIRREVLFALGKIGPTAKDAIPAALARVDDPDATVRYSAVYALGRIGPNAAPATERLLKELESEDYYYATCCAMSLVRIAPDNDKISPRVLPLLIGALKHDEPSVRAEAANTLGMLGPKAQQGLNALKNATYDQNSVVRQTVADAIAKIVEA